jgi:hypothetical protein
MAQLPGTFNPDEFPSDDFDPVPDGWYPAQIIDSEIKDTASGGQMLKLSGEITDGDFTGRLFWDNLNIVNRSEVAQRIASQRLGKYCAAVGLGPIDDTEDLHNIPFMVKLVIEPGEGQYRDKNIVKDVKPYENAAPQRQAAKAPAQPSRAASSEQPRANSRPAAQQRSAPQRAPAGGARPWGQRQQPAGQHLDDDIPF